MALQFSGWSRLGCALLASFPLFALGVQAAPAFPQNFSTGLERVVQWHQSGLPKDAEEARQAQSFLTNIAQRDGQGRVLVNIHLSGKGPLAQVKQTVQSLGLEVVAESATYRKGVLSAYLPLDRAIQVAQLPGVSTVSLVARPKTQVGNTTSQGVVVHKTDQVNTLGFTGEGVTIGVLSDSYNTSTATIKAANDIASGDLPGTGNPLGNTTPLVVLQDSPGGSDEGRGMLQIIHDLAPKSKLCFATAFISDVGFAQNILNLADPTKGCDADVIVDDVSYFNEPMFSDGIIAQAAQQVVNQGVSYFSSAGNSASTEGFASDWRPISDATARAGIAGENLKLSGVPAALTSGGFLDFDPSSKVAISQSISVGRLPEIAQFSFQWNDPFNVPGGITTDYNLLIFRADGTYVGSLSGTGNNFTTNQPIELIAITGGLSATTTYQVAITRAGNSPATPVATKLRYNFFSSTGASTITEFIGYNTPITFGHNSAAGANGVAAYIYDSNTAVAGFTPTVEGFTSPGPVTIYFDAAGTRLTTPELRQKPDLAAVDGVNTTFFPIGPLSSTDYEGDGFPNFFGTSAAAPHAAAMAALLLDKNPSLTPAQVKAYLQGSAPAHDLDPNFGKAVATGSGSTVTVTGTGDGSNYSSTDTNFFKVTFSGPAGRQVTGLTIDLTPAGLVFDPVGFPVTPGVVVGLTGGSASFPVTTPAKSKLTFSLTGFDPNDSFTFGVDRDVASVLSGGNSADVLAGATISATVSGVGTITGTFTNLFGSGFSPLDGYGLVDALSSVNAVP